MKIHPHPVRIVGVDGVAEDVIGKGVLAEGEEHKAAPFGEGGRVEVEGHRNESADVEDAEGLRVEGRNGVVGDVVGGNGRGAVIILRNGSGGRRETASGISEGLLVASDLSLKGAALGSSSLARDAGSGGLLCGEALCFSGSRSSRVVVGHATTREERKMGRFRKGTRMIP